jgi:PBSX family phage terminase large subunit
MIISDKQKEFIRNANHRYNIKIGARRCGKTYLDILYLIPKRIIERKGKDGLNVIFGVSKGTIERNVLQPLREIYGKDLISSISSQNIAILFGEEVYCLGCEKVNQVSKIQGTSIKYAYGDEIAKWCQEVFIMIQASLDKPYSCFDGALNPESNTHWFKTDFLDQVETKGLDVYIQSYTIFDNPFLPKEFVDNLCKEYEGTVYYNRLILGQWCNAEGLIYKRFADNPQKYKWTNKKENGEYDLPEGYTIIGIDYGGNKSGQAFVCTRISYDFKYVIALGSERHMGDIDPDDLFELQIDFAKRMEYKYNCKIDYMLPDNEEVVIIRGLKNGASSRGINAIVRGCIKEPINDRIDCERTMIAYDIFYYIEEECKTLVEALSSALWDDDAKEDTRLDDFTSDIDTLDAFEYSFTRYMRAINDMIERRRKVC